MAWQSDTINPASTSPAGDITKITNDLQQLRSVVGGGTDAAIPAAFPTKANIVGQDLNRGTTGGTSTAYTLTPSGAITAYSAGQSFWVTFHTASGASPTLQISGVATPPALVRYNSAGALVAIAAGELPANFSTRVTLLSATQALIEEMPPGSGTTDTLRIDVASAATVNLTTGAPSTRNINITGTTAITAFTVAAGLLYFVRFNASLTLTNGAGLVTQTGANIVTQAGDTCILRATAANVVEVVSYSRVAQPTLGTSVATTSGTAIDITGIPSWVNKVSVLFNGISTAGAASGTLLQLGTSGGVVNTGYTSTCVSSAATNTVVSFASTAGLAVQSGAIGDNFIGVYELRRFSGNTWIGFISGNRSGNGWSGGGSIALGGALDRIRLTNANGTDTFDAGSINVMYE